MNKKSNTRTGETTRTKGTEMQDKFAYYYVYVDIDDPAEAYKHAGYKNKNPYEIQRASKTLLKNENIQKKIKEYQKIKASTKMVDAPYVIKKLVNIVESGEEQTKDVIKALELIGKYLKMFTDKIIEKVVDKVKDDALAATEARMARDKKESEADTVESIGEEADNLIKFKEGGK